MSVRWRLEDGPEGARFVVSGLRLWPVALFLGLWLCGWTAGEVSAFKTFCRLDGFRPEALFLVVWLAGWTAGGVFAWAFFLYSLFGREIVLVGAGRFRLRWQAGPFFWTRDYLPDEVRGMRVVEARSTVGAPGLPGFSLSAVAFRHAGGRMAFGLGLPADDARALLEAVRSRGGLPAAAFAPDGDDRREAFGGERT